MTGDIFDFMQLPNLSDYNAPRDLWAEITDISNITISIIYISLKTWLRL